ncbi:conserved hypothetical protein [Rhizobium tibeticum]|uniref:Flippase-like domain-containing protein n=1 Tax=Rhizobium tibeticum TaxID=501024 RepID=A0A1H8NTU5_9HYPH|nr:lysylphosphatidylglycerol synthase transmembrane domain-containing protein [Rhizobium tibeticum]SEI00357.1 hypothetical protein RTCCBAU85039_3629 [Rhizobium tibeticum]SEO33070.1 conserved hypothetical protein [Rhizobium tibeticum]
MTLLARVKPIMFVVAKLAMSAGAIYFLLQRVNIQQVLSFRVVNFPALALAVLAAMGLVFLQAVRWYLVANSSGIAINLRKAIIAVWFGHFLNNLLPTSTAGDVVRNYTLKYESGAQGRWVGVLITEKFAAMFTALIVATSTALVAGLPGMPREVTLLVILVLAAMMAGYLCLWFIKKAFSSHLSHRIRTYLAETIAAIATLASTSLGRWALICSLAVNLGMAMIFYMSSVIVGVHVDLSYCFFVVPVFSVIASLPISYGGWGVRELSGVHLLGLLGIASDAAFAVTVVYGVINLLSCIPGLLAGRIFVKSTKLQRSAHKIGTVRR